MDKDVKDFAKAQASAKKNYTKYLKTNKPKYKSKADFEYAKRDALAIKLGKPDNSTKTTNINIGSRNKINKSKTIKVGVDTRVKIKNQKTDK